MTQDDNALPPLEGIKSKISEAEQSQVRSSDPAPRGDLSLVMRFSVELLAGVVVGGLLGYALDSWFGTLPIFLIVCLLLGSAGGMLNVIRTASRIDKANDAHQEPNT